MKNNNQIVSSQTLKFSLINYFGAAIGILSTLFIYPRDEEFLGTLRYIFDGAQVLMAFCVFGSAQALIHFFPRFKETLEKRNIFFTGILAIVAFNCLLVSLLILLCSKIFSETLASYPTFKFVEYSISIAVLLAFIDVFKKHAANYKRIAVPTFLERFLPKIIMPGIFLLLFASAITADQGKALYVLGYCFIFVLALVYVFGVTKAKLNFKLKSIFNTAFKKEYFNYSIFTFFAIFGSYLAFKIDGLMVPNLLSFEANGVYSIGVILASTLAIPSAGVYTIYSPIIAEYLDKENIIELGKKYKEVSRVLLIIGGVLYSCIFVGVEDLFMLLPTKDVLFKAIPIILVLGANVVIDMSTGFNSHIITYSKYYRFNMVAIFILAAVNITLNYYFISEKEMGIVGAAYATIISMTLFNIAKLIFIYKKLKIQPFTIIHFWILLLFSSVIAFLSLVPLTANITVNLIVKIVLCLGINGIVIYKMNWIPAYTQWIKKRIS